MPSKILACGATVFLDDEDMELVDRWSWHICRMKPTLRPFVARTEKRYNRMHRLGLHREIAIRRDPSLPGLHRKFVAMPKNGNYLDCRRENIEVTLRALKRGAHPIEPRPIGWLRAPVRNPGPRPHLPPASPSWAGGIVWRRVSTTHSGNKERLPCVGSHQLERGEALRRHGPPSRPHDRDAGGPGGGAGHQDEGVQHGAGVADQAPEAQAARRRG